MTGQVEAESWEELKLKDLSFKDETDPGSAAPSTTEPSTEAVVPVQNTTASDVPDAGITEPAVETPLLQALSDPKERPTVLRIEAEVLKFLKDPTATVLEFSASYGNFHRMLAHKVAQYYGLQTSTVDYENNQGRVVANRTKSTNMKMAPLSSISPVTLSNNAPGIDRPKLLTRPSGSDYGRGGVGADGLRSGANSVRSAKEREDEYERARERILGSTSADSAAGGAAGRGAGRGYAGGRNGGSSGPLGSHPPAGGRGRGRRSMYRDRGSDDPDYARGMHRYSNTTGFDPSYAPGAMPQGMYHVPTYNSEFPTLSRQGAPPNPGPKGGPGGPPSYPPPASGQYSGGAAHGNPGGGQHYRPPPPPPPPNQGASHGSKSGSYPSTPTAGAQSAMAAAPPPPQMTAMRPAYPAAVPLGAYPVPAMGMAYAPGMAAPQAMYNAPAFYAMAPSPAYGFMAPPGQEAAAAAAMAMGGATPMVPMYGYAGAMPMYPQAMAPAAAARGMPVYGGYGPDGMPYMYQAPAMHQQQQYQQQHQQHQQQEGGSGRQQQHRAQQHHHHHHAAPAAAPAQQPAAAPAAAAHPAAPAAPAAEGAAAGGQAKAAEGK